MLVLGIIGESFLYSSRPCLFGCGFFGTVEYILVSVLVEFSHYVCYSFAMCLDEFNDMDSDHGDVCLYISFIAVFALLWTVSPIIL